MRNKNIFGVFCYAVIMLLAISVAFAVKPFKKLSLAEEIGIKAKEQYSYDYEESYKNEFSASKISANEIERSCKSFCLIDAKSGEAVLMNNETKRLPIASMCKIMTLILCFENLEAGKFTVNDSVTVSERASGMGGSQVFLEAHKVYPVKDLIKSIVVASANDSCVAMAEKISGSVERFVTEMNNKAKELKMTDTNFVNPTGLPQEGQYSSAADACKMFKKLISFKEYFDYSKIWMDRIEHEEERYTEISNTNKLLKTYPSCDSGKTGYTSEAGHCITASAKRDGTRFIACVIGANDGKTRFKIASNLLDYGFNNFEYTEVITPYEELSTVKVKNSKDKTVKIGTYESYGFLVKHGEKKNYEFEINVKNLKAPLARGENVGEISVYVEGVEKAKLDLVALSGAKKEGFSDIIKDFASDFNLVG